MHVWCTRGGGRSESGLSQDETLSGLVQGRRSEREAATQSRLLGWLGVPLITLPLLLPLPHHVLLRYLGVC